MVGRGSSGGGEEEGFTGRAAIGYDHGYDAQKFYLGLALNDNYIEGFVEECLERIGRTTRREKTCCATCGLMPPRRRPYWTYSKPSATL